MLLSWVLASKAQYTASTHSQGLQLKAKVVLVLTHAVSCSYVGRRMLPGEVTSQHTAQHSTHTLPPPPPLLLLLSGTDHTASEDGNTSLLVAPAAVAVAAAEVLPSAATVTAVSDSSRTSGNMRVDLSCGEHAGWIKRRATPHSNAPGQHTIPPLLRPPQMVQYAADNGRDDGCCCSTRRVSLCCCCCCWAPAINKHACWEAG